MFCGKCGCPEDKGHFDHCPEINPNYKWEVKPLQGPLGLIDYIHFRYRRTHDLIVETDIGHDPDDFFAVCYLVAAGVRVRAILVVPGDPDQIAIARLLCKELKLDIPIGASKLGRTKRSSGSIHHELLKRYGHTLDAQPDAQGNKVIEDVLALYPGSEFFVIGPVTSLGTYLHNILIQRSIERLCKAVSYHTTCTSFLATVYRTSKTKTGCRPLISTETVKVRRALLAQTSKSVASLARMYVTPFCMTIQYVRTYRSRTIVLASFSRKQWTFT